MYFIVTSLQQLYAHPRVVLYLKQRVYYSVMNTQGRTNACPLAQWQPWIFRTTIETFIYV